MKSVFLIATLDTKAAEIQFIRDRLKALNVATIVIDVGCLGQSEVTAEVTREEVFLAAGSRLDELQQQADRGVAISWAAKGATALMKKFYQQGEVAGVLGIGGSAGTTIATSAMQGLPLGLPKVMVSTMASGDVQPFIGVKDITMINSVVDLLGINRISRKILTNAADAIAGMVLFANNKKYNENETAVNQDQPVIAATMFGVTTACIEQAKVILESAGYEVLVFHATGSGGRTMESLIRDGFITAVLDITTTELADELVGGVLSAGEDRLTAATEMNLPQVISVGATDMVNFGTPDSVPQKFRQRKFYQHNDNVTLMRTTAEECEQLGTIIGKKAAAAKQNATIMLPSAGVSAIDRTGQPFDDPLARETLFTAIREHCGSTEVIQRDEHINDPSFAAAVANRLLEMMKD